MRPALRQPFVRTLAAAALVAGALLPAESVMQASPAGTTLVVPVAGVHGVPADAAAVAVNLTATNAAAPGYLRAYPCGDTAPTTSSVNYFDAAPVANFAVVGVGEGGAICVFTLAQADVIVDVQGSYGAGGYASLDRPERLLDTREGAGRLAARSVTQVDVAGRAGVAADATAVAVNLTVTEPEANGYVTAYPCGGDVPATSSVNFLAGQTVANFAVVGVGAGGDICLTASAPTQVIVDVQGAYVASGYSSLGRPERLLDTRTAGGTVAPRSVTRLEVAGGPGVPADASAVAINLTATEPGQNGYVTAYPCGDDVPATSSLNYRAGQTVANFAVVGIGEGGAICMFSLTGTEVVVDLQGAFVGDAYTALGEPERVLDTRTDGPGEGPGPDEPDGGTGNPAGPLGQGDVLVTFDNGGGADQIRQGVYHRNVGQQELGGPVEIFPGIDNNAYHGGTWTADHDMSCGSPDTQRTLSSSVTPGPSGVPTADFNTEQLQFACRDHWMTSMGDVDGYSIVWFAPPQQFSRSEQRTVSWDVNTTDLGGRKWWEVSIVPVGSPFLATVDWLAPVAHIDAYDRASVIVGSGPAGRDPNITTDGQQRYDGGRPLCGSGALDPEGCASKPIRRPFSITDNGNGTLTVNYGGLFTRTVPGQFPERFEVYFKDHSYTPDKDGPIAGHTLHWDNISVR